MLSPSHNFCLKIMPYSTSVLGNIRIILTKMRTIIVVDNTKPSPNTRNILLILFHSNSKCRSEKWIQTFESICLMFKPTKKKQFQKCLYCLHQWVLEMSAEHISCRWGSRRLHADICAMRWAGGRSAYFLQRHKCALLGHGPALLVWAPEWRKKNFGNQRCTKLYTKWTTNHM